jgi:hypothetical protein
MARRGATDRESTVSVANPAMTRVGNAEALSLDDALDLMD